MDIPQNFNNRDPKPRVLVAPLDWGLGHATRCIPIISKLTQLNCEVIIAAEGAIELLLQKEFPGLRFIPLQGYGMRYSRSSWTLPLKLLLQFPKLLARVYSENRWLKRMVREYKIDAVISDNRLGLNHKYIPCIYITHQLQIKTGNKHAESLAQKIHYHFINRFSACWVPDAAGETNLAGELSHPPLLPRVKLQYLGPLSRFEKTTCDAVYDLCILLSGPEPQRSIFETQLLKDLEFFDGTALLLRGLPGSTDPVLTQNQAVEIKDHLPTGELNRVLLQSKIIICRSGYTSVMDLVKLQKKAILVPTPGQTEQEYLARYLQSQNLFYTVEQKHFSLEKTLKESTAFHFKQGNFPPADFEKVIEKFVAELRPLHIPGI